MTIKTMTVEDYAALLAVNAHRGDDRQDFWDARAGDYDRAQRRDDGVVADGVVAHLVERGLLEGAHVLDVGAGAGRYALRIAPHAAGVHLTDVSGRMLARARANAEAAGLTGLGFTRTDWITANLDALRWRGAFDVVFASMVPATRRREGIDQMVAASRSWCVVNQLIRMRDDISEHIKRELGMVGGYDPHNDRDHPRALLNYVWLRGHLPTISYVEHRTMVRYSVEEAAEHYAGRFGPIAGERGRDLHGIVSATATDGHVVTEREHVTAVISWRV